jgi:hypothetical protein
MKGFAAFAVAGLVFAAGPARADTYVFDRIHRGAHTTDAEVDAGVKTATQACDPAYGQDYASRRFLSCMRGQGYKFVRVERAKASVDSHFSANVKLRPGHYIDHDTGMDCENVGIAAICSPPEGTVHYFDPDQGLPCTRTGIVSVCSNF